VLRCYWRVEMPLRCARRAVRTSAALAFLLGVAIGEEGDNDFGLGPACGGGARDPESDLTGDGMDREPLLHRVSRRAGPNRSRKLRKPHSQSRTGHTGFCLSGRLLTTAAHCEVGPVLPNAEPPNGLGPLVRCLIGSEVLIGGHRYPSFGRSLSSRLVIHPAQSANSMSRTDCEHWRCQNE